MLDGLRDLEMEWRILGGLGRGENAYVTLIWIVLWNVQEYKSIIMFFIIVFSCHIKLVNYKFTFIHP